MAVYRKFEDFWRQRGGRQPLVEDDLTPALVRTWLNDLASTFDNNYNTIANARRIY